MGNDRRLGVGREPGDGLSSDRCGRGSGADRDHGSFAAGENGALDGRGRSAFCDGGGVQFGTGRGIAGAAELWGIHRRSGMRYGYQFCGNFQKYAAHETDMPVDTHELLGLIAPRPLYLATASLDLHSDPRGEFDAAVAAGPIYQLLGACGLDAVSPPPLDTAIMGDIGYHCHTGTHELTRLDWQMILKFADLKFGSNGGNPETGEHHETFGCAAPKEVLHILQCTFPLPWYSGEGEGGGFAAQSACDPHPSPPPEYMGRGKIEFHGRGIFWHRILGRSHWR